MSIFGMGTETYLYINGLVVEEEIILNDNTALLPVSCNLPFDILSKSIKSDVVYSYAVLFADSIGSQLKITATTSKELAIIAWNSQWDIILLNAILNCSATWNLQCTDSIDSITDESILSITNHYVHRLGREPYNINYDDVNWLKDNFKTAKLLMAEERFSTAVHSLASYNWHSLPRVQLAVLWMGIESLFEISSELVFRLSLCAAKFLEKDDDNKAREIYNEVKQLYKARSSAVHGSKIKGDSSALVKDSALLLNRLIKKCVEKNELPVIDKLLF